MLHRYAFSNFQSFRDRTEVDLTLNRKTALTHWMTETATGEPVTKLMAVIGPNGSGKTALLKPLVFLNWFVSQSFQLPPDKEIPVIPHFASPDEPTEFEAVVDFDGKVWRYVLRITRERVLHEALYLKRERFGYVFTRDWDAQSGSYLIKQQDFGLPAQEARKVRPNVSLISWAAQFGVPLAVEMTKPYVISNVGLLFGRLPTNYYFQDVATSYFASHPKQRDLMSKLLSSWDMGLSGVEILQVPSNDPDKQNQMTWRAYGRHRIQGRKENLPFIFESSGTQGAFVLLARLLETLEIGGLAVIDEFENDLHPHMLEPILDLFANETTNPGQAQLLFTCHSMEVLNLLHKSQVMLVEKNTECESVAYRLDTVKGIRNDDNLYAKYMAGAYGAVPSF